MFKGLEEGNGAAFFDHVDENVDWTVEDTHPLAGHYHSKADFISGTFAKLEKVLPRGAQLVVEHLLVKDDQAVVELRSLATAKNGLRLPHLFSLPLVGPLWGAAGRRDLARSRLESPTPHEAPFDSCFAAPDGIGSAGQRLAR